MRHETACYAITVKQKPKSCVLVPCWNKECDEAVMNVAYRRMRKCLIFINAMELHIAFKGSSKKSYKGYKE